ncbi:hypothetical protein FKP32DRAFT_1686902 [Trametes sanguinea]|nr:hypothetical protein FKP32DRAFT_1686902 [Trametes sanguinea]
MSYYPNSYTCSQDGGRYNYECTRRFAEAVSPGPSENRIFNVDRDRGTEYRTQCIPASMEPTLDLPLPCVSPSDLVGASPILPLKSPAVLHTSPETMNQTQPEGGRRPVCQYQWARAAAKYDGQVVVFELAGGGGISLARAISGHAVGSAPPITKCQLGRSISAADCVVIFSEGAYESVNSCHFEGLFPYTRQIMSLRATRSADPIVLYEMARKIARDTKRYLELYHGGAFELRLNEETYGPDEIFLSQLRRISKGSWQPEYYVERR